MKYIHAALCFFPPVEIIYSDLIHLPHYIALNHIKKMPFQHVLYLSGHVLLYKSAQLHDSFDMSRAIIAAVANQKTRRGDSVSR